MRRLLLTSSLLVALAAARPAGAHVILFMDSTTRSPEGAMQLVDINVGQEPTGFLEYPGDVQYIRFDADPDQVLEIQAAVVKKRSGIELNPTFVICGPGLPEVPQDANLPFVVPTGSGALVLEASDQRTDFQDAPYDHFLVGPEHQIPLPGGTYLIAVFDREGRTGEYKVSIGRTHAGIEFAEWQLQNPDPVLGDLNGDELVDVRDALVALQVAAGLVTPTARQRHNGDVAPPGDAEFVPGDNRVTVQDAIRILRYAAGLDSEGRWP